jgi:hypothetical protein
MIALQVLLPQLVEFAPIYNYRIEYDLIKDRPENINIALKQIGKIIEKENLDDYIVILGDSVGYSSPGSATQSIGYYMERRTFNLSLPSNQMGDIYTVLLMMEEYGISRDNVIINIIYSGFATRNPYPSPVFWFYDELKARDSEAYEKSVDLLVKNKKISEDEPIFSLEGFKKELYKKISITNYKDVIKAYFLNKFGTVKNVVADEKGQTWKEKEFLVEMLKDPMQYRIFWDENFDMSDNNLQIYFINKIINIQQDKNTLFFLTPFNRELMSLVKETPNYDDNLELIEEYFIEKNQDYLDLTGKISYDIYSDHIHLIPEGYKKMAELLDYETNKWFE